MKVPKKYAPLGFDILYEDRDLVVGNKAPGFLTVAALWNKDRTIHAALNSYVRKGQPKSPHRVYVVHRLDQDTSGVLVFAKSAKAKDFLKDNWANTKKYYYAIVKGKVTPATGKIESYLEEDEDYKVHSTKNKRKGELAQTAYEVVKTQGENSLVRIDLITGKKNQIRVHMADIGHPVIGDAKYGQAQRRQRHLMLHAHQITFLHPFHRKPITFTAPVPGYFSNLVDYTY